MPSRIHAFSVLAMLLAAGTALAQQPAPIPLYPNAPPRTLEAEPLPPPAQGAPEAPVPQSLPPAPAPSRLAPVATPLVQRVFCAQAVTVQIVDPDAVPNRFRGFIGMFSDAAWTPQLCAALVVENITAEGIATIVYAYGPMGSNSRVPGGVLHGTGVVKDGELRFQNSDGSQFAFRLLYADLDGRLTTPQGQTYEALFKKTL